MMIIEVTIMPNNIVEYESKFTLHKTYPFFLKENGPARFAT